MLKLMNIDAGYGKLKVLHDVNIQVNPNEIVALIGPNGAGKSTIIKSIFKIAEVTKGKVIFKRKDISRLETHELMELNISFVPQGKVNFTNLTVKENLLVGANLTKDQEIIDRNLERVYDKFPVLEKKQDRSAYGLSGGQQQILALGRALMQNPAIILLDEPSLGLSPKLQKKLFKMIKKLKEDGIAVLIVEQNAKKAIEIADRTYLLEDGKVVLSGGKNILKDNRIRSVYLGGR